MAQPRLWTDHPLQNTYRSMISRCYHKGSESYSKYGGRGIRVCDRWLKHRRNGGRTSEGFANFVEDMGPRPDGYTLDRIDNNGDYSPSNCRWASRRVQALNRNKYYLEALRGEKHHQNKLKEDDVKIIKKELLYPRRGLITELAKRFEVDRRAIYAIKNGETWAWL